MRSTSSSNAIYRDSNLKIWYVALSSCSYYARQFGSNVSVIDGGRAYNTLRQAGWIKGYPTNVIITGKDMKIHYNASGYSSRSESTIKSKLRLLLSAP